MTFKKYLSDAQRLTTYKEMRRMGKVLYASAIGSIMYVMTCTRPDVTYVLSMTSRFQYDLGEEHWTAVKAIQRYLRRTKDMLCFMESFKYDTIATLSIKTEYIVVSEAAKAAYLMKKFIEELGVVPSIEIPLKVYCDNSSIFLLASECITQRGSRHILCRHHYIRKEISLQNVEVIKVHTNDNTDDPLTKALPYDKHEFHVNGMGPRYIGLE
nr:hypothetical protein [Tanacetum cinerariifolium]